MVTLRVELKVRNYDLWRTAFERDSGGRRQAEMRGYRIYRPIDDHMCVMIEGDFDRASKAQTFLDIMRTTVWNDPEKAPAKIGAPKTHIVELVESHDYDE